MQLSAVQCRRQYDKVLRPIVETQRKIKWTADDDLRILVLAHIFGNSAKAIHAAFYTSVPYGTFKRHYDTV